VLDSVEAETLVPGEVTGRGEDVVVVVVAAGPVV